MIDQLAQMFSSKSRTSLLFLLAELTMPVCLTELSELSENSICATHAALKQLRKEKWVLLRRRSKETFYRLNLEHPAAWTLQLIGNKVRAEAISKRAEHFDQRAKLALDFASDTQSFLSRLQRLNVHP